MAARLAAAGAPPEVLAGWYERTLRDGFALSLAGGYVSFPDVAASALRSLTGLPDAAVTSALSGFSEMPAYPDAIPACKRLADAGIPIVLLTNSAAKPVTAFAASCGLSPFVTRVISVGEVRRWKPSPIVYRYAAELLDVPHDTLAMVSAHPWDIHGAKSTGLLAAHISRPESAPGGASSEPALGKADSGAAPAATGGGYPSIFAAPDVSAPDLVTAVEALLSP